MASLFGMIKSLFGGGSSKDGRQEMAEENLETRAEDKGADPVITLQHDVEEVVESVVAVTSTRAEYVAEQASEFVEETAHTMSEVAHDIVSGAEEEASDFAASAGEVGEGITDALVGSELPAGGTPVLNLALAANPPVVNRDEFNLPRSELVKKAVSQVEGSFGKPVLVQGLRVYEYAISAALGFDWRVDRELLLIASLFSVTGESAAQRAAQFAKEGGMWEALAERIAEFMTGAASATDRDEPETRALALGLNAEAAGGAVAYINPVTATETKERNAA